MDNAPRRAEGRKTSGIVWTGRDPRGRLVRVSRATWQDHVLVGHPEVRGGEEYVWAAIREPFRITRSASRGGRDREVYERRDTPPGYYPLRTLLVTAVVEWRRETVQQKGKAVDRLVGTLCTAYYSATLHRGEVTWEAPPTSD